LEDFCLDAIADLPIENYDFGSDVYKLEKKLISNR
jgi:hypothetical protein